MLGPVNSTGTDYYNQFTDEDYLNYDRQLKKAENYYWTNYKYSNKKGIFNLLFGQSAQHSICKPNALTGENELIKHTATCFPGYKISVSTDGIFYLCERVGLFSPIGDVDEGLNYSKIIELMRKYFEHMDKCKDCKVRGRCNCCFVHFETDKGFKLASEVCKEAESVQIGSLTEAIDIVEKNPSILDKWSKYQNLKKYCGD